MKRNHDIQTGRGGRIFQDIVSLLLILTAVLLTVLLLGTIGIAVFLLILHHGSPRFRA